MTLLPQNVPRTFANGYLFGVPVRDLGFFATLLIGLATGFIVFFAFTFFGILGIMLYNAGGHHVGPMAADYSWSYSRVGLPAGLLAAAVTLGYLGYLWTRRILRRG